MYPNTLTPDRGSFEEIHLPGAFAGAFVGALHVLCGEEVNLTAFSRDMSMGQNFVPPVNIPIPTKVD